MATYYGRPAPPSPLRVVFPLLLILIALGAAGLYLWHSWFGTSSGLNPNAQPRPVTARGDLSAEEQANIEIYQRVAPSVVHVTNSDERGDSLSFNIQRIRKGTGTGFVWDKDGYIVTNNHVVEGGNAAQVILADQSTYETRKIWTDPDKDIAILHIQAPARKLPPVMVGTSHDLKVGQIVYAIGNPFGLDQTMTMGIVSALGREIETANGRAIQGAIQSSAAINPGNSGGPLLDSADRVIGMNTAILSPSGAYGGIGFAIPIDEINQIVPQLIRHGKVVHPRLGVTVAGDQLAERLGVDEGALIVKVAPDSPAAEAGLQGTRRDESGQLVLGDVIVGIDDKAIKTTKDLYAALDRLKVGDKVKVAFLRRGQRQEVELTMRPVDQ
jgi:S1-C subfamily serine protease